MAAMALTFMGLAMGKIMGLCRFVSGVSKIYMDLYRFKWMYMDLYGFTWICHQQYVDI